MLIYVYNESFVSTTVFVGVNGKFYREDKDSNHRKDGIKLIKFYMIVFNAPIIII